MSPEQQRIKIAEVRGWLKITKLNSDLHGWQEQGPLELIPNYPFDLNAMHEAEKMLRKPMKGSDTDTIIEDRMHKYAELIGYAFDATAAQRAEAFLRTLNLWTEE